MQVCVINGVVSHLCGVFKDHSKKVMEVRLGVIHKIKGFIIHTGLGEGGTSSCKGPDGLRTKGAGSSLS